MRKKEVEEATGLHRPDEEIADRPRLKVARAEEPAEAEGSPRLRSGTLYEGRARAGEGEDAGAEEEARKVSLPRIDPDRGPSPYATHRPPPADEEAEKVELEAAGGTQQDTEISAGFLLGIALIVVALLGGILIARLQGKVNSLESRLSALESDLPAEYAGP